MKDQEFDDLLKLARGKVPLPTSFHHDVWKRIHEAECDSAEKHRLIDNLIIAFVRPRGIAAGIAAMVTLGLWLGDLSVPDSSATQVAYAASISPFAHSTHK